MQARGEDKDEETMEHMKAADDAWEARRIEEFMPWEKVKIN